MNKIALITDSTSDLNKEDIEKYNIKVLPLRVIYKDREYMDRVNITPSEVYDNLVKEVPTTSLPSMLEVNNLFSKLEEEGYTHAIAICISSGISGTYNMVNIASEDYPTIKTHVFDSKSLTMGEGAIVIECGKMIASGKSFEEIVELLPSIQSRIKVYYVVETLTYLIQGGRIGKVAGTVGELLQLKPIISINEEGTYYTYSKVRGRNKSIAKLVEIANEALVEDKSKIWVLHGGALEDGKSLYETISKLPNLSEVHFGDISPVLGVHTGPGLLGIVIMKDS